MNFQTRSDTFGLNHYPTMAEAYLAAKKDKTIWKISFSVGSERIRLVRNAGFGVHTFEYAPIETQSMKAMFEGEL